MESETDPSYFDDFTNPETLQDIYSGLELTPNGLHNPAHDKDPSKLPPRSAFIGFTYRHRGKHFSSTGSSSSTASESFQSPPLRKSNFY